MVNYRLLMEDMSYYIIREILRSELYERCEKKRCIFGGGSGQGSYPWSEKIFTTFEKYHF